MSSSIFMDHFTVGSSSSMVEFTFFFIKNKIIFNFFRFMSFILIKNNYQLKKISILI